jgi:dihydroorotase-like cyclic amidohydrolase
MSHRYDALLKNAMVVDPTTKREGTMDVAVAGGKIADIAPDIDPTLAEEPFDVSGYHVVPGIIDLHMHASAWLGGKWGHKMMAEVGVTTALDMSGPVDSVMDIGREHGVGLNIAGIEYVRPGHTVRDADPGKEELQGVLLTALRKGAIGLKLLGGHYPLTPEATARAIEVANQNRAYIAFHAGTLEKASNIEGLLQAAELAAGHAIHIAHINSYCRGAIRPYMQETEEAIAALERHPNLHSESYSAARNLGYTFARAASFAGKALGLAGHAASPRPSPRALPRGAGRRPSSDSPPDCAVPGDLSPILRTAQYLSPLNGTSAKCAAGVPESRVTQHCLKTGGFPPTEAGFEEAILAGWAQINVEAGGRVVLGTGKAAVDYWRGRGTDTTVSFNVNPPEPRLRLATAKRQSGDFVVDCISTDGGGIPRNVIVDMGLSLVRLQALSLAEFVRKTSTNPARILGLKNKGHFGADADADITVLDLTQQKAVLGMSNGQLIMYQGHVCGRGGRFITTAAGAGAVREKGLQPIVVDLADSAFYR